MRELAGHYDLECLRLRLLLKRHIAWLRTRWTAQQDESYQGTAIPDSWADHLLEYGLDSESAIRFYQEYAENDRVQAARQAVLLSRSELPIGRLAQAFELTDFDCDLLMLSLAPEIDPSIEILFAYALDDSSRKYPTAQLALALFAEGNEERLTALNRLSDEAPLRRFELVRIEPGATSGTAHHSRPLKLDSRIREFLLGSTQLDSRLLRLSREISPIPLPKAHRGLVDDLKRRLQRAGYDSLLLTGPADSGKQLVAREVFKKIGRRLLQLDPQRLPPETSEREEMLRVAAREARLAALAYFMKAPEGDPGDKQSGNRFLELVERLDAPVVIDSAERLATTRKLVAELITRPARDAQEEIWTSVLGGKAASRSYDIAELVEQFDLGPENITAAAEEARARTTGRGTIPGPVLWETCRAQCAWRMEDLAQKLTPSYSWKDIVLSPDTEKQLTEISAQVSKRAQVYERWGFARGIKRGRGINALFSGASGVGKTMSAEVLANDLNLDLYRIDLAGVVSKYIGETEKNLRRIFDAAEQSGAILFFDEADALFGKRSEVKDSHDRYANIEINYLLQRMEEYRGLAILATNRKSSLDRAFLRRLRFLVDFPFPNAAHRREIWQKSFPPDAPLGTLDYDFLSGLEVAGGNIRNIALNAAFIAAGRQGSIELQDVLHAVRREYSKIDKLVTESEFGKYYGGMR